MSAYPVYQVPADAAKSTEQLGTKYKIWFLDPDHGLTLFKEGRPNTGENWAEKAACELASLLHIPHALYELAEYGDKKGVISPSLVARGARLVHGNELLGSFEGGYGEQHARPYRRQEHTLRRVLGYLKASAPQVGAPVGFVQTEKIKTALDVFIGYLMFDALIANQDRHDENWALLRTTDGNSFLAPTYDHGSSMGRNETDTRREFMLATRDRGQQIPAYAARAKSAVFPHGTATARLQPLSTIDAFLQSTQQAPSAAEEWRERLRLVEDSQIIEILARIPDMFITPTSRNFTGKLLCINKQRILESKF